MLPFFFFFFRKKEKETAIKHLNVKDRRYCDDFSHPIPWSLVRRQKTIKLYHKQM